MLEFFIITIGFAVLAAVRAHIKRKCGNPLPYIVLCIVLVVVAAIQSACM